MLIVLILLFLLQVSISSFVFCFEAGFDLISIYGKNSKIKFDPDEGAIIFGHQASNAAI